MQIIRQVKALPKQKQAKQGKPASFYYTIPAGQSKQKICNLENNVTDIIDCPFELRFAS
jgi:hypothetical protein